MPRTLASNVLLAATCAWCLTILAVPLVQSRSGYELFQLICHQDPNRSWMLMGHPLPVCIRCASIYFGAFAGLVAGASPSNRWLRWAFAMTIVEVAIGYLFFDSELLRAVTGFLLGSAAVPFVRTGFEELWRRHESV